MFGHTVDTNAAFVSEAVTAAGAQVLWRTTVGDNIEQITEAIAKALHRTELVIATGGLGPTHDDVTKKAICKYFHRPLVLHDEILKVVENRFKARGMTMPAINQNQALLPQGANFIENPLGSAVGIAIEEDDHLFVALPGVPDEMRPMVSGWVADAVRARSRGLVTIHRRIKTTGIFESALFEKVADLIETRVNAQAAERVRVAFLPSYRGVEIRLTRSTQDAAEGRRQVGELEARLAERIGEYIYGYDDDTLPGAVGKLLKSRAATLAVAESCTGGLLGKLLTDTPGSSEYFVGGVIAYSDDLKRNLLGVAPEIITKHGAVSDECARAMADGARERLGSTYAVSVTGVAGPNGGTAEKPVGLVYFGLSGPDGTHVLEQRFGGNRERNRERSATLALEMVRRRLMESP